MNAKLIAKLMMLVLGLLLVFLFQQKTGSKNFTEAMRAVFGPPEIKNTTNWCADHVVDFVWTSEQIPVAVKEQDMADLREQYCELKTEAISGIDLDKVVWQPLAESSGAAGAKTKLEWSPDMALFRAGGMPFMSSEFAGILKKSE